MNMLEKINKSGVIKIIGKKLIVWDFSTNLKKNAWLKIKISYNRVTKNELINFDIELRGISYVFCLKNQKMRIIHYIFKYNGMP